MLDFLFKRKQSEEVYVPPVETKLYLLVEVQKQGLIQYFHENGVEVYFISTTVDDIIDELLLEESKIRLVVIDSGRGRFDDKKELEAIEGLIEVVCDMGNVSMFSNTNYFNSLKKRAVSNNKERAEKIDVFKSSGAVDVLTHLQEYNEVYNEGGAEDVVPENVLEFQPTSMAISDKDRKMLNSITRSVLDIDSSIYNSVSDSDESLPRYGKHKR